MTAKNQTTEDTTSQLKITAESILKLLLRVAKQFVALAEEELKKKK
jgi:hypothetical protein